MALGVNSELDDLRNIAQSSQEHLQQILERETGANRHPFSKDCLQQCVWLLFRGS